MLICSLGSLLQVMLLQSLAQPWWITNCCWVLLKHQELLGVGPCPLAPLGAVVKDSDPPTCLHSLFWPQLFPRTRLKPCWRCTMTRWATRAKTGPCPCWGGGSTGHDWRPALMPLSKPAHAVRFVRLKWIAEPNLSPLFPRPHFICLVWSVLLWTDPQTDIRTSL